MAEREQEIDISVGAGGISGAETTNYRQVLREVSRDVMANILTGRTGTIIAMTGIINLGALGGGLYKGELENDLAVFGGTVIFASGLGLFVNSEEDNSNHPPRE